MKEGMLGRFLVHRFSPERLDVHMDDAAAESLLKASSRWSVSLPPGTGITVLSPNPRGVILQRNCVNSRRGFENKLQWESLYIKHMPVQTHSTADYGVLQLLHDAEYGTLIMLAPLPSAQTEMEV